MQFNQYSFFLQISKLKINTNKFLGKIYVSWNLSAHHKDTDPIFGPAIVNQQNNLVLSEQPTITTKLVYNKQQQQFHPKKSVLHFIHYDKEENSKYTNVGVVTIDLANLVGEDMQIQQKICKLEKCFDRSAQVTFKIKSETVKQSIGLDRSLSIDSKGSRVCKDQSQRQKSRQKHKQLTNQILKTALKASKRLSPEQRSKTNQKPIKAFSTNGNTQNQNIIQSNLHNVISQYRSQRQLNLSRQINDERTQNNILSSKIAQLQQILRKSNSNGTNKTITQLQQALSSSKINIDSLKRQLKQAKGQIKILNNKIQVLVLEKNQLKSELQTNTKLSKKVTFENQQTPQYNQLKQQLKKQKLLIVQLQNKLLLQSQETDNLRTQNQNLLQQMDNLLQQIQHQKKQSDNHRVQYEQLKLSRTKRRKERDQRHKQKMLELSKQVLRLHQQLYNLRITDFETLENQDLIQQNKQLRRFCSQKKQYQKIKDTVSKMSSNRILDAQTLKTVRSKSKEMRERYTKIHSIDAKIRQIILSITQIRSLNVKSIPQNNKKLSEQLLNMEEKLENLLKEPLEK